MREDEVYAATKNFLMDEGWIVLGGQPPNGCDHLPILEIKSGRSQSLGSKHSYKPDLVCFKRGVFLLVECKPRLSESDAEKLRLILASPERIEAFFVELMQRSIFKRHRLEESLDGLRTGLRGALAHADTTAAPMDLLQICNRDGLSGRYIPPTTDDDFLRGAL
jgi:hypothetical protein